MNIWARIVLLTAIASAPSLADDLHERFVLRDNVGRMTGTVERGIGGEFIQRDTFGRRVGTVDQGFGDDKVIRDRSGRRTGPSSKDLAMISSSATPWRADKGAYVIGAGVA